MLVRTFAVVLLGDEVREQAVRQCLVPVRVDSRDVDRDGILVTDVLGERLAGRAIEDDDADHPGQAEEYVVLPALVEMQPADDALAREREVRLLEGLRQRTRACELGEPAALVRMTDECDALQAVDHRFTPFARTKSLTS